MPINTGDWRLVGKLGQGGFGEVQHWKNQLTNQEIATKHIKNADQMSLDQQRKLRERWIKEYQWTLEFPQLPNIVAGVKLNNDSVDFINYLNSHHIWQLPVIILEYCNGGDLRKHLQQPQNANGLTEFEVREILSCLRQAVDFLHTRCFICHRDLKPDNIVINRLPNGTKQYKLTDFGLARNSPDKTIIQSVVGTRHYYAPEVVDTGKYNITVDYWSMGVIGYEVATGVLPFIPHQKPFNIHVNIKNKQRNCIAITEDIQEMDRFHFHSELPVMHHLSTPWTPQFTKWLTLALDKDYTQRGTQMAPDEVQVASKSPIIFTEIDNLLKMRVLTLFVVFKYQRLEYVVTPTMTMPELGARIAEDTGLPVRSLYLLLPTGHPHKRLTQQTQPMDLYVDKWCDTSEEARNPPVMVYIFNMTHCEYSAPDPCMTDLIKYCHNSTDFKPPSWVIERMVFDMHFVISKEQTTMQTMLFGFKEYAMTLEHDILNYQPAIKSLESDKDKCHGAIDHFATLIAAAKEQQRFLVLNNDEWEANWMKLADRSREIFTIIEQTIRHYESSLRSIRDVVLKQSIENYNRFVEGDIYKLSQFRNNYIRRGDNLTCSELDNILLNYLKTRHSFLNDDRIRFLREGLFQAHNRFSKIPSILNNSAQGLNDIRVHLLQLQLQMLPSAMPIQQPRIFQLNEAMSQLHFDAANDQPSASLDAFDSLSTKNIIDQALLTSKLLEHAMDTELS
ncbi:hypothetical protein ACLKA6_012547 [Drosophila palustris]